MSLTQELDWRDHSIGGSDYEEESETQLNSDVVPDSVTEAMSVDHVILYLKKHDIPDKYCKVFKGKVMCPLMQNITYINRELH